MDADDVDGRPGAGGEPSADDPAATLSDVVFAYDRDVDLPDPNDVAAPDSSPDGPGAGDGPAAVDGAVPDPDARGGAVLRGVDLAVPAGSFTVVMGASGGGKSTLLRTVNAIIPDFLNGVFDGDVEVLGRDATASRVSEMAEVVGMVLQDYESQLFGTSIAAEVAFGPENFAVPPGEIDDRIDESLELAGLADLDRRRAPDTLSGGQKQRLVFAGVAATRPELLVLDEPTSDLDPAGSRDVLEVVRTLADGAIGAAGPVGTDGGTGADGSLVTDEPTTPDPADAAWTGPETILLVTHKIEEALLADHAVLLRGGRVYRQGPAREVFTDTDALRASRVAVPPVVDAFDRVGIEREALPLSVREAVELVDARDLEWTPPARAGESLPGVPAGTGESPGEVVFAFEDLVHEYHTDRQSVRAVDGVDLEVREGEVLAIVGHNGSGKTTLAKHFNGLLEPDAGSATWRGRELADCSMAEVGREIGYVFQNPDHQIFAATVEDEVAFGPENFGLEGEELEARVAEAIETVELDGLEDADPFNLSKGQRQRVALASILATEPEVIVFDEPTTGLDATQQDRFMDLVARLNRERGVTVVMITHGMSTVAHYAPRTVVMADGRVVADRPTRALFADEAALAEWELRAPQPVALSNRLAEAAGLEDALPALSVEEVVEGLGGPESNEDAGNGPGGPRR